MSDTREVLKTLKEELTFVHIVTMQPSVLKDLNKIRMWLDWMDRHPRTMNHNALLFVAEIEDKYCERMEDK